MSQDYKSSNLDEPKQQAEPGVAGQEEGSVGTESAEARIWAAATKLGRDGKLPFPEIQE
jgi:hypothetical protein